MRKQQLKRKNGEGKAAKRKLPSEKTGGSAWLAMVQGKVKEQFGRLDMKTLLIRNFPYFIIYPPFRRIKVFYFIFFHPIFLLNSRSSATF